MKKLYSVFLYFLATCALAAQPSVSRVENFGLRQIYSEQYAIPLNALGGQTVNVWKAPSGDRYYVQTYLAPDWAKFAKSIDTHCGSAVSKGNIELALDVQLDSEIVRNEVRSYLSTRGPSIDISNIHYFNFATLTITTGGRDSTDDVPRKVRLILPEGLEVAEATTILSTNTIPYGTVSVRIADTCDQLRKINRWKDVQGQAHVVWDAVTANHVTVTQKRFVQHRAFVELLSDEQRSGRKGATQRTSSGGFGINIPGLSLGNVSSSATTEAFDTRRRAVTSKLLDDAVSIAFNDLRVEIFQTRKNTTLTSSAMLEMLMQDLKRQFETVEAEFKQLDEKRWELRRGNQARILDRENIDDLLKSSSKPELKAKTNNEVEAVIDKGNLKGKDERELSVKDEQNIEWHWKGKEWIPTKVTLYESSMREFSTQSIAGIRDVMSDPQSGLQMLSLARIDAANIEHHQGYLKGREETMSLAFGPRKNSIMLPPNLFAVSPKFIPTFVICTDWKKTEEAVDRFSRTEKRPTDLSYSQFLQTIHCVEVPSDAPLPGVVPKLCATNRCLVRTGGCLVSERWLRWRGWHSAATSTPTPMGPVGEACLPQPKSLPPIPMSPELMRDEDWWRSVPFMPPFFLPQ